MDTQTLFAACERNCGKYVSAVLKIKALKIKALGGLQISQAADNDSFSCTVQLCQIQPFQIVLKWRYRVPRTLF